MLWVHYVLTLARPACANLPASGQLQDFMFSLFLPCDHTITKNKHTLFTTQSIYYNLTQLNRKKPEEEGPFLRGNIAIRALAWEYNISRRRSRRRNFNWEPTIQQFASKFLEVLNLSTPPGWAIWFNSREISSPVRNRSVKKCNWIVDGIIHSPEFRNPELSSNFFFRKHRTNDKLTNHFRRKELTTSKDNKGVE